MLRTPSWDSELEGIKVNICGANSLIWVSRHTNGTSTTCLHPTLKLCVHRSSSATNFVLFKHVFSLFLFSAALNNAAFKNDFKGLFLEPIIALICDGLCSALRNNPAIIWDNKTPSSSSYWGDVTLTGRQSLCLGEVWDLVIWSMCCP